MDIQKRQGLLAVIAAVVIQLNLGVAYIWSVFQTGIAIRLFGGDHAAAGLVFSLMLAVLTVGAIIGGRLAIRYSYRLVVLVGGVLLSAGFFLSSFVTADHAWLIWVTYSVIGGIGNGFCYTTTIACAQKWYPHRKGFVSGVIVSGFGFGGVIFTPIVQNLIGSFGGVGVGEARTFMVLSAVFLVVCVAGSFFQKVPPEGYMVDQVRADAAAVRSYPPGEMVKTPQFYLATAAFTLAVMGGLMMITFAMPIAVARGLETVAALGVMAIAMFNSLGRLFWGGVSDKLGRVNTLILLLIGTATLSLLVNAVSGYWIFLVITLIGFCFGGILCNYPPLTADLFGPKFMATNYGFVLLGFGVGAIVSTQVAGYYKNIAAHDISLMYPAFVVASSCAVAAILMMLALKRTVKRQKQSAVGNGN